MRTKPALGLFLVCLAAPANTTAQTFFSMGREIHQLGMTQPVFTGLAFIGDLALCSDRYLYFVQKSPVDLISRLNLGSSSASPETVFAASGVREIRLTKECDVMYATATGLFRVKGRPPFSTTGVSLPTPVPLTAGSGLAVAFDGTPRHTNQANVVGLNVANGGDGSLIPALPIGALCRSELTSVICRDKFDQPIGPLAQGLGDGVLAQLSPIDNVQFCEFFTNDSMMCAASYDPEAEIKLDKRAGIIHNGTLQLITAAGVITQVFEASTKGNVALPIVGVAVGPSDSQPVVTPAPSLQHRVNFGPVSVHVDTPRACKLSITLHQLWLSDAIAKTASASGFNQYSPDAANGGESWFDNAVVTPAGGNCGVSAATPARLSLFQFNDVSPNRAGLHCKGNACTAITETEHPYSLPDDGDTVSRPDDFSDFLTGLIASSANSILFNPPLDNRAVVQGAIDDEIQFATTHSGTGGMSVRFRICDGGDCTRFLPGEFPNPPASGAGFGVTRFSDTGVPLGDCDLDDNGGANPDRPVFRIADDGITQVFNVNTPMGGPPPCQLADLQKGQSGLFGGTVFFHHGGAAKKTILFRLQK